MIYFIKVKDFDIVKIGYTINRVNQRFGALQTGCPFELEIIKTIDGSNEYEWILHRIFSKDHLRGEWHTYSNELKEFIAKTPQGTKNNCTAEIQVREERRLRKVKEDLEDELARNKINRTLSRLGLPL